MIRDDYDVWKCIKCPWTWVVPAVPHKPTCPLCGEGGWWQSGHQGAPYKVVNEEPWEDSIPPS